MPAHEWRDPNLLSEIRSRRREEDFRFHSSRGFVALARAFACEQIRLPRVGQFRAAKHESGPPQFHRIVRRLEFHSERAEGFACSFRARKFHAPVLHNVYSAAADDTSL